MYNERYYIQFKDYYNRRVRIGIYQKGYESTSEEIEIAYDGAKLEWNGNTDSLNEQALTGSRLLLNLISDVNFKYIDLLASNNRQYYAIVERDSVEMWRGYIVPNIFSEPYTAPPYTTQISFVDGLSSLKDVDFEIGNIYTSLFQVIKYVLDQTGFTLNIVDGVNIWPFESQGGGIPASSGQFSPFNDLYINTEMYEDKNCYEVLDDILRALDSRIFQNEGKWWILRNKDLSYNEIMLREVNGTTGLVSSYGAVNLETLISVNNIDNKFARYDQQLYINPAWKRFKIIHQTGAKENLVTNGDFKNWSRRVISTNPYYAPYAPDDWDVSTGGQILQYIFDNNPAAGIPCFNDPSNVVSISQKVTGNQELEANEGQVVKISFDLAATGEQGGSNPYGVTPYMRIKNGEKYLRAEIVSGFPTGNYIWGDIPVDLRLDFITIKTLSNVEFNSL